MSTGRERSGVKPINDAVTITVNGRRVYIEPETLTMKERQLLKREMAQLGYDPDETDILMATIWVVMKRDDAELTFDEVCESITVGSLTDMETSVVDGRDLDDPEG